MYWGAPQFSIRQSACLGLALDASQVMLQWASQANWFYTCQASPDLTHWNWLGASLGNSGPLSWTDSISPVITARFYRVEVNAPNTATITNYHGWTNAILLNNGWVETIVVPAAGRVLQFRFAGATSGPFWENPALFGRAANANIWNTKGAFGGDKAWPSPQSDWNWPPPVGFDGSTNVFSVSNGVVTLVTPVDNTYKIRTTRIIELGFGEPVMRIKTIFERTTATSKTNNPIGVWVISQTQDPVRCYVPVPTPSLFSQGYTQPDGGSSTEIYTNPTQTAPYVEMEMLAPLAKLPVGGRLQVHDHLHPLLPARIRSGRRSSQNPRSALMRWCGKLTKRLECEAAKAGVRSPCG